MLVPLIPDMFSPVITAIALLRLHIPTIPVSLPSVITQAWNNKGERVMPPLLCTCPLRGLVLACQGAKYLWYGAPVHVYII